MLSVALIGVGQIAQYQIEALEQVPGIQLESVFDKDVERFSVLPPGVKYHDTLDSLLKKSKADLYIISTPNITHFDIGRTVIEKGRPVLLEKPVCTSEEELDSLLELALKYKQFVSVAFHAAFAQDVLWWLEHSGDTLSSLGRLTGFDATFLDPYIDIDKRQLLQSAKSLGGSWIDSGINALSVIARFIDPTQLYIDESRMTILKEYPCSQVQGLALMSFPAPTGRGHGIIDTNWTLSVNRKTTRLWYENGDILLHHSLESIFSIRDGKLELIKDLSNKNARLTNHYKELFIDLVKRFNAGEGNIESAAPIHRLLFKAMRENVLLEEG